MFDFEWDSEKAKNNFQKHGIKFEEAKSVFYDPFALYIEDKIHSIGEERFNLIGLTQTGKLIVISFTERNNAIRIISSRLATKKERKNYEENN